MRVAIFGGSFDPPHVAHVLAVAYVLAVGDVDEVLVVPCFRHPLAKALTSFADRFAMCERAMGWLPRTRVSRVEEELGGESRTLRTLEHLAAQHPGWQMRLVVGADVVVESPRWHGYDAIARLAPPLVLGRAGVAYEGAPPALLPEVSSSAIRRALAQGESDAIAALVPRDVLAFIAERGLYRAA